MSFKKPLHSLSPSISSFLYILYIWSVVWRLDSAINGCEMAAKHSVSPAMNFTTFNKDSKERTEVAKRG